ncbi:hypothetical protein MBOT_09600 [Mycobacterium botniense]|uniref:Uncharacterized protein n=1 Tax=Mycobacterium botniense TaxID=84962 RepID=A0A7I9XUI2_9MYCO|nr:hypothetical protein MBOT_09600 [Mycobacterium botniense]
MANLEDWFAAARLTQAGPVTTIAAIPIIARTHRTTARMAPIPVLCHCDGRAAVKTECVGTR